MIERVSGHTMVMRIALSFALLFLAGCMAQQADVARIKRELDQKIAKSDASRESLQAAVAQANQSLSEANAIISRQRAEIKDLIRGRADLLNQVTTIREGDLSQVRGELDRSQHAVGQVAQDVNRIAHEVKVVEQLLKTGQTTLQDIMAQVAEQRQMLQAQVEQDKEFQKALTDFRGVLSKLNDRVVAQEVRSRESQQQVDTQVREASKQSVETMNYLKDTEKSVTSVVKALEKVSATLMARVDAQDRRLTDLTSEVRAQGSAKNMVSSQDKQIEELSRSIVQVRNALDHVVDTIGKRVDEHERELSRLVHQAGQSASPTFVTPVPAGVTPRSLQDQGAVLRDEKSLDLSQNDVEREYGRVQELVQAGNYVDALKGFSSFLSQHPNSPLAANAQYWMGECYYAKGQYVEAIREFERVIQFFPQSAKVPAALLKIGYSHLNLQNHPVAKATFHQLVRTFPQTPEAAKATVKLLEVDKPAVEPS